MPTPFSPPIPPAPDLGPGLYLCTLDAAQRLIERPREPGLLARLSRLLPSAAPDAAARTGAPRDGAQLYSWLGPLPGGVAMAYDDGVVRSGQVAVIDTQGLLLERPGYDRARDQHLDGYAAILNQFRIAFANDTIGAVFWRIESPGGMTSGLFDAAEAIVAMAAAADGKPVICHVGSMAGSAGYALACAADEIHAARYAVLGSIGAVYIHVDESGALEKQGLKLEAVQFGDLKTARDSARPLSDDARAQLQAEIDDMGARIVAWVAGRRGIDPARVLDLKAGIVRAGMTDPAIDAVALGLCDSVADEAAAFARAAEAASAWLEARGAGASGLTLDPPAAQTAFACNPEGTLTMKKTLRLMTAAAATLGAASAASLGKALAAAEEEKLSADDVLAQIRAILKDAEAAGDDDDAAAKAAAEEEAKAKAEADEEAKAKAAADEEDAKAKAAASGASAGLSLADAMALMRTPEAKANPDLAAGLAELPGMTMAKAKSMLATSGAGRGFPGAAPDPAIGADGGHGGAAANASAEAKLADRAVALAGVGPRGVVRSPG
jgi:capsid assembly protease